MNAKCTCGVELVEGARFCHKCGRPVNGIEPIEEVQPPSVLPQISATPPLPLPAQAQTIGFSNRDTVRAALLSAAITFLPSSAVASVSGILMFVGLLVNGLLGVLLYLRRTGRGMTTIEGARQGWISGLFFFVIAFLMWMLAFATSGKGGFMELMHEQAKTQGNIPADAMKIFEQPALFVAVMVAIMLAAFVLFTSLASVGGMLGARMFGNSGTNSGTRQESNL